MENRLATYFDHTILKFDTSREQVKRICHEAIENDFFAVCIPPYFVKDAKTYLENSPIKVATVVGFPLGYQKTLVKSLETKLAIEEGADEVDMVINNSAVQSGDWDFVEQDILALNEICHDSKVVLKVIIESAQLSKDQLIRLCEICTKIGVDFVKTSTGFNGPGADVESVRLMKENISERMQIKASGGIRTLADTKAMIDAGANRIGASSSVKIIQE